MELFYSNRRFSGLKVTAVTCSVVVVQILNEYFFAVTQLLNYKQAASTYKSSKAHTGNVSVTRDLDL